MKWGAAWTAVGVVLIAVWLHPHYLSYFNLIAGGPANGARWLLDSNIDWGQDLIRLEQWMDANQVPSVRLGWHGTADPAYYHIPHEPLPGFPRPEYLSLWTDPPFNPAAPEAGIYAISANSLWEFALPGSDVYAWFRRREPDDRVGYSILIFRVP